MGFGVVIGDGVRVQNNVLLYEGVEIGDEVFIGLLVVFMNVKWLCAFISCRVVFVCMCVECGVTLGVNAMIICDVRIGEYVFVAVDAVVIIDVLSYTLVEGVLVRLVGKVYRCGERLL